MGSLLEACAVLGLSACVVATMIASLAASTRVQAACTRLGNQLFETRQLEHLVDRAVQGAGAGPGLPSAVSSVSSDTVVFAADSNGDRRVDTTSAESSALEVRQDGSAAKVRIRFGRQTMTVLEAEDSSALLRVFDQRGAVAAAASSSLVDLTITPTREAGTAGRRLLFAIPARIWP